MTKDQSCQDKILDYLAKYIWVDEDIYISHRQSKKFFKSGCETKKIKKIIDTLTFQIHFFGK